MKVYKLKLMPNGLLFPVYRNRKMYQALLKIISGFFLKSDLRSLAPIERIQNCGKCQGITAGQRSRKMKKTVLKDQLPDLEI